MPLNPLMPSGAFNICCPRDCVSRHHGGTSGAPLKPLRVDSALRLQNVAGDSLEVQQVHPSPRGPAQQAAQADPQAEGHQRLWGR